LRTRDKQVDYQDQKKEKKKTEVHFKEPEEPQAKPSVASRSGNRSMRHAQLYQEGEQTGKDLASGTQST